MEGAPVTAATGVLGPVVAKLGVLLGNEYKLQCQTRKDVKFIKSKLKSVHSILWMVWGKEIPDKESKDLKKEVLDLADDMQDTIDDFIPTLEPSRRSNHLKVQTKIKASPFQDFRTRVGDVLGRCRRKWKPEKNKCAEPIFSLFSRNDAKSSAPNTPPPPPPRAPFVRKDISELAGMEMNVDFLRYNLVKTKWSRTVPPQLKTASIFGMAGVGKTTLADLVYQKIGNKFQSRAFVSLTPSPNMKEVLTSILQQVQAQPLADTEAKTEEEIIHAISNFLADKRYLVIIDGIWHREEWDIISKSFPRNNLFSRIVVTTPIDDLLDDFDKDTFFFSLNPKWSSDQGCWLYGYAPVNIAARMMGTDGTLSEESEEEKDFDHNHPIVRMCGGVPLAVLCMLQAVTKEQEKQAQQGLHAMTRDVQDTIFKQVKENGIQNTPGFEPLVETWQLCYDNLPHHMSKTCLLYCSTYPEYCIFCKDDLVVRWVAEGFSHTEDVAEGYFQELCDSGLMLSSGSVMHMNPMMRNFLRWKLREDNFITCSSDITSTYDRRIHRLCIDYYPKDIGAVDPLFELDWSQIRSLVVFEGAKRDVPFDKLERARVLDLGFKSDLGNHHVKDICGLLRVRHLLGLHGSGINEMPPEIARLQFLETLQFKDTLITGLPGEIGDLQQLKSLDVSDNAELAELGKEIGNLENLETLRIGGNKITKLPGEMIRRLNKLKTLDVSRNLGITELPREIGELQDLETLDLSYNEGLTQLPREVGKLQDLKQLLLRSTGVVKIPREIGGLKKLEILDLDATTGAIPWEASQFLELEGVPNCVRQAWKNSDLVSELAGEILSIRVTSRWDIVNGGLIIGTKHMRIPGWIKEHFNDIGSLDIRMCKLEEEQDVKILREMPSLKYLTLRLEVVQRKPIAISGEGFRSLEELVLDCRMPPVITFQEVAMPKLEYLSFQFRFYGGSPANKYPQMGIKHLLHLKRIEFKCRQEWYGGAVESSPCMSAMFDVVRKEAQEHPRCILFCVSGREDGVQLGLNLEWGSDESGEETEEEEEEEE